MILNSTLDSNNTNCRQRHINNFIISTSTHICCNAKCNALSFMLMHDYDKHNIQMTTVFIRSGQENNNVHI